MANRFLIRSGATTPTVNQLLDKEIGYNTTNKRLYINDSGVIRPITSLIYEKTIIIPQKSVSSTLAISGLFLTANCSVFIDVDFSKTPTNAIVKAFRKADLVYSAYTSTTLTLKINGKSDAATSNVPIQITVVY